MYNEIKKYQYVHVYICLLLSFRIYHTYVPVHVHALDVQAEYIHK